MNDPQKDLQRLLQRENFESEEEIRTFMQNLVGKKVPEVSWEELSNEEKAEELVQQAYDADYLEDAIEKIEEAFRCDPQCIGAYIFKSEISHKPAQKLKWLEKALEIGSEKYGGKYEEENKGHFWGIYKTRPYMEALHYYAIELHDQGRVEEAIEAGQKMLRLNPNDNQGIRNFLGLWLIETGKETAYFNLTDQYPEDYTIFSHYNAVLLFLKTDGETEETEDLMIDAVEFNPYVVKWLLSKNPIGQLPEMYNPQDESGAVIYCHYAKSLWKSTFGSYKFLKKFETKAKNLIRERE